MIGTYVSQHKPRFHIEPTDDQKTTFNLLIPQAEFYGHVKAWSTIKLKEANSWTETLNATYHSRYYFGGL